MNNNHRVGGVSVIKIFGLVVIVSIIIIVISCATFLYKFKRIYSDPYDQFLKMQTRALPYFDKLNERTLQELPEIPDGFSLSEKKSSGIENNPYAIGRWLTLTLTGPQSEERLDRFYTYYKSNLLNTGWKLVEESEIDDNLSVVLYQKGTSCLELSVYQPKPYQPIYFISIWQDFEHQPFISNIPSDDVTGFYLIDSWKIAKCP